MPDSSPYDLVVIGAGPAGEKGAAAAAYFGKRVAIVERMPYPGGAGINTGTVPSKTLRETALYFSGLRQRGLYGIDYSLKDGLTVAEFLFRERQVVENERLIVQANLERHGIDLIQGEGSLLDSHTVRVRRPDGTSLDLATEIVLLATGSSPFRPADVPFDDTVIYDSDSILRVKRLPARLAVVGGGVIGVEYASIFSALGVAVTVVDGRDRLLSFVDREMALRLQERLGSLGVRFRFSCKVTGIAKDTGVVRLTLSEGAAVEVDTALFAAGRQSNVAGLGLERVGVATKERGLIEVNEKYQTTVPNIYAAGDVIGFPALASTSMEQARVAIVNAFELQYRLRLASVHPLAVYSVPEIAMVGLTEEECRAAGRPYLVGRTSYAQNPRGQIIGDSTGMLKLVFSPEDNRLLGVHIIGEQASELIHLGAHVLARGESIDVFVQTVFNYPSLSDCYKYAAYDGLGNRGRWLATGGAGAD